MEWKPSQFPYITNLTPEYEKAVRQSPLLNIDSLLIPSPYIRDNSIDIDYEHSFVWDEKGELLGYLLVYATPDRKNFHIYKLVTNPFGRGKGIGSAFLNYLVHQVDSDSHIYLYVWDKLLSSIDFFQTRGFSITEQVVYRKMKFHLMSVTAATLRQKVASTKRPDVSVVEELSKVRHDVKKSLKVLFDMTAMLSVDNFNKVAEDINRETTAMLNTLNMYEDNIHQSHKVSLKDLITERVIPFIEAVNPSCVVKLVLGAKIDPVNGSYVSTSRALINVVSNALDAIKSAGRPGLIEFSLGQQGDSVTLAITDNGIGIAEDSLKKGADQLPLFVGKSTKGTQPGKGVGTQQTYATFGADHIEVTSKLGEFTRWTIRLKRSTTKDTELLAELSTRYVRLIKTTQKTRITKETSRNDMTIFIWQLRQMELFSYDLIYHFSRYNNIRDIFQSLLLYRFGGKSFDFLKEELGKCRIDNSEIRSWLLGISRRLNKYDTCIMKNVPFQEYKDVLFQSYGQATDRTMIFTLDPDSGNFFTTDRKLAEHLDFVSYLGREKDELLRGELVGDVRNVSSPIYLGVWTTKSLDDLQDKMRLIQRGAQQLLLMGFDKEKRIAFYNTTYNTCEWEIDTLKTVSLGEMATLDAADFGRFIRPADSEMSGLMPFG
ncbi:GNAT family N-acetyltransferase [Geopsychrobacter electrodiphilus]|uniref:GNAT family N-acetyltransferase n=1 Tax=Geopsychrobacter electrodiphilus TaxID=225196 RepID=UPI0003819A35|nr:GNAT family N-acetyltransferase [Geopsychrobacter electrodiphilus]